MSGCHQPETKLIKESVENAKMRIDIFSLNTVSVNHELRIQALEKERDRGIERLKKLEDSCVYISALEKKLTHINNVLTKKIEKLENCMPSIFQTFTQRIETLEIELDDLDTNHTAFWKQLAERTKKLESAKSEKEQKVPQKCPLCQGHKKILTAMAEVSFYDTLKANLPTSIECYGCKGTGIM